MNTVRIFGLILCMIAGGLAMHSGSGLALLAVVMAEIGMAIWVIKN